MPRNSDPSSFFCSLHQLFLNIWICLKYVSSCSLFIVIWPKFEFRKGFVKAFAAFELPLDSHFNLLSKPSLYIHIYSVWRYQTFFGVKKKTRPSIESSPSFDHAAVFVRPAFLILKRFCFGESRFSHQAPRRDGGIKKCLSQLAARGRGWWEWALHL